MGRARLSAVVRPAAAADLDAISEIFAWYARHTVATFEETPRAAREWDELHALLNDLRLPFLVAEADGAVAGYA